MDQEVSVVICAFTEARWDDLVAAWESLQHQSMPPDQVIIVIDYNQSLLERACQRFSGTVVVPNAEDKGLSGARNTGVGMALGEIVLFLDDDAVAETEWVRYMTGPFDRKDVVGVGGLALPSWDAGKRPLWFPEEFLWVVGCSYVGLPTDGATIRNPIGSSMGFRRSSIIASGGFASGLGRIGSKPLGGEETELSMRIRQHSECNQVVLCRRAIVNHRVPIERQRMSYFMRRCYWEGISKSAIVRRQAAGEKSWAKSLSTEQSYVLSVLPAGVARGFGKALHEFSLGPLGSPAAIVGGLAATFVGYARGALVQDSADRLMALQQA
jgi:glycosyltransferase involved in cell wall biosynthesis